MIVYLFLFVVKFLHRFFFFYCCFGDVRYPWYMLNPYVTRSSPETLHEGLIFKRLVRRTYPFLLRLWGAFCRNFIFALALARSFFEI